MQLSTLLTKLDAIENSPKESIFESIGRGDHYFSTWERDIHPVLCEVALSQDQIQQLFKSIEAGAGRSALGKGLDVAKGAKDKISDVWFNKFGGMLQSSGPVQAFDQKFEEIKSKIGAKHPELASKLAKYGEFAKNNPNLHKFLLAIAGSAAAALGVAVAGGVGAGALAVGTGTGIAVGILNIADRLLQGQKASTAIGRGATTGAIAGLAAGAAAKIGDMVKAGIKSNAIGELNGIKISRHTMDWNGQPFSAVTQEPLTTQLSDAFQALGTSNPSPQAVDNFAKLMAQANSMENLDRIAQARGMGNAIKAAAKSSMAVVSQLQQIGAAAAGGVASAATNQQPPAAPVKESLNKAQLNELFGITGNKVDASKLQKAWEKAGSPLDSEEVAKILTNAGVDPTVISKAYADMSLPAPAGAADASAATPTGSNPVNIKDLMAQIKALGPAEQKQVLAYLKR